MCRIFFLIVGLLIFSISCKPSFESGKEAFFSSIDPLKSGIDFRNDLSYDENFNVYLFKGFYNGAGVGLGDMNNDGLLDIFFCGNQVDNKLYLNKGNFIFVDVTNMAGLASPDVWSNGVSIVDINGDGWLDIYVCKAGKPEGENRHNELFINQGIDSENKVPVFIESAKKYGIDDLGLSVHAAFFDMDRDGDLDMYLLNNSIYPSDIIIEPLPNLRNKRDQAGGNKLYRNDGDFFTDISEQAGIYGSAIGFGLGVSIGDVNRDGWQDIYVANDFFEKDYLYINNQNGTFSESLDEFAPETSQGAMGVDIADMNNDGFPEIFVTEMLPESDERKKTKTVFDSWGMYNYKKNNGYHRQFPRNSFQLNNGYSGISRNISFSEISRLAGVEATDWSWGVVMADFNNNGNKELFITNGITKDLTDLDYLSYSSTSEDLRMSFKIKGTIITDLLDLMPSVPIANSLYVLKDNQMYNDVSQSWGISESGFSNGVAYGDLDNDGDLDLVVNNINMTPFLYRNNSTSITKNYFLDIKLESRSKNRDAIGSQVTLWAKGGQIFQELLPMRGTMSTVTNKLHFGLGEIDRVDSLEVIWPDGKRSIIYDVPIDKFLVLQDWEMSNSLETHKTVTNKPFMTDVSGEVKLDYVHKESDFNDFDIDRLRATMISNEGPKLAIGDVNKDGFQDVYIGGAKGFSGALYQMKKNGSFERTNTDLFELDKLSEDTDAVFVDVDNDSDEDLLVISGSYEFSGSSFALANRIYINDGNGIFTRSRQAIPANKLDINSCIALCDFDKDGDQDIFLGGRVLPSSYGVPPDSYLFENDGRGNFEDVTAILAPFLKEIGMITDAKWFDYDQDGDDDLFVCGDWMPIRAFKNENNTFAEVTEEVGLSGTNGFWQTLEVLDADQDGKMDIIAGNLGLNTQLKASKEKPVSMYINDFDHNGTIDHIITVFNGDKAYPIATKEEITKQIPFLETKFPKHVDYMEKTIEEIFTPEQMVNTLKLEVFVTASMVFWNNSGHFKAQQLPVQAQIAPIYDLFSTDLDHDSVDEILLGGNQYRAKPQTGIYAASFGLMIKPMANRKFDCIKSSNSGFFVDGEIRDIDKLIINGNEYILVARNNAALKIFKINQ